MHIVRVNHKNGLLLEFIFLDPGKADECAKICAEAKLRGNAHPPQVGACHVFDEAGRETWLDGACMQSVQSVDLESEVVRNTQIRIHAEQTASAVLARAGFPPQDDRQPNGRVVSAESPIPGDQPAAGAIGRFSG